MTYLTDEDLQDDKYPFEMEKDVFRAIRSGDREGAQVFLNKFIEEMLRQYSFSFNILKDRLVEIISLLSRAAMHEGEAMARVLALNSTNIKSWAELETIEEAEEWMYRTFRSYIDIDYSLDPREIRHADYLNKSIKYIYSNYAKNISLADVAAEVGISSAYLSYLFKNEYETNFISFLNGIRIEKSRVLLFETDKTITEICEEVGYHSQSYFTKVFRKITGTTPKKFRNIRGAELS